MCWNTIAAGKWKARPWNSGPKGEVLMAKTSHCQLELDVWFADVVSHKPEGEFEGIAPLRILSFDIECAGRPGVFPEAERDPVIQIANHVTLQGENAPVFKNVFTLDTCASISGAQVVSFEKEADMLAAWSEFVRQCDPDLMTGYNIINFDLPYLLDRASALKIKGFPYLGRLKGFQTRMKDKMFQSKQVGTRESKEINIEGRVQFDVLQVLHRRDAHTRRPAPPAIPAPLTPHPIPTSPGAPARLQAVVILAQRRVRPFPRRAEGGRPPLDHLRPPGGQRRHAPPPRRLLPEGRVPAAAVRIRTRLGPRARPTPPLHTLLLTHSSSPRAPPSTPGCSRS